MAYPYRFWLCFVNENDNAFVQDYAINQEVVLAFSFSHQEGDFATLDVTIKNPHASLLGPGRKRWAWLSYDDGEASDPATPIFFGQVIAIPGSLQGERITYTLMARPAHVNDLKRAMADTLRERPYWIKALIDKNAWQDDDLVLETRASAWYFDPVDHDVDISSYIEGEEGIVEFEADEHLYDALDCTLGTPPVHTCEVKGVFTWTQQGTGTVDLTEYIRTNWPNQDARYYPYITSFNLKADDWPKTGSGLKDNWKVHFAEARPRYDLTVKSATYNSTTNIYHSWGVGEYKDIQVTTTYSEQYVGGKLIPEGQSSGGPNDQEELESLPVDGAHKGSFPSGSERLLASITTDFNHQVAYTSTEFSGEGEGEGGGGGGGGPQQVSSVSTSASWSSVWLPMHHTLVTLVAAYEAQRPYEETVKIVLQADMQPVITVPDQSQVTVLEDVTSMNLSEEVDPDNYEGPEIGDRRARSYVTQVNGRYAIEYLILLARSTIISNSRALRVKFRPVDFDKFMSVTLQSNCLVHCERMPTSDGQAFGKVIEKTIDYGDGSLVFTLTMACCVGRGGSVTVDPGEPVYVEEEYIEASEDWQEYTGRTVLVGGNTDVTYTRPLFAPLDDGLDLIAGLTVTGVIDQPLTVENSPAEQLIWLDQILDAAPQVYGVGPSELSHTPEQVSKRLDLFINHVQINMDEVPTTARFTLKPMNASFFTDYNIPTSVLKLPKQVDLES